MPRLPKAPFSLGKRMGPSLTRPDTSYGTCGHLVCLPKRFAVVLTGCGKYFEGALRAARDNTVRLGARWLQIPRGPHGRSYAGCRVEVRELLDGRLLVFYQGTLLAT